MSKKAWLVLILILGSLCALGAVCTTAGYLGYKAIISEQTSKIAVRRQPEENPEISKARSGGVLRLSGGRPPTLDPALVQDSTSAEYVVHLFSGLVTLNSQLEIVPDLASRWEVSQDGRTYTFHLLPTATFQDGKSITAQDFVYSLERACSPRLGSPVAPSYLGDIVGVPGFVAGRAEHITGLSALSDNTLQIEIDAPKAYFLAKLTYSTAFVVDKEQIEREGEAWLRHPNGSGPFVLERSDKESIILARNERYYGERPALQRVEYILSGGLPITMYENGRLDIVGVAPTEIERVLDPHNPLYAEHRETSELSVQYLGFNVNAPPFDELAVRQAFAQAIDKAKIADLVLKGTALPAVGILPPSMPDYDETITGLPYDPERARQLLASSRYASPGEMPQVVLAISGTSGHMPPVTRAILSMVEENLGIEIMVEQIDWPHFLRDLNEQRYPMFSAGWIADYPDSQDFLDLLFHSQSAQNHTGYRNAEVDRLLEAAREGDRAERRTLYRRAERIIVQEVPWIPLTHGVTHTLVKPYVKGLESGASLYPWLKGIYLEN